MNKGRCNEYLLHVIRIGKITGRLKDFGIGTSKLANKQSEPASRHTF